MSRARLWARRAGIVALSPFLMTQQQRSALASEFDTFLARLRAPKVRLTQRPLYIDLGCGWSRHPGWVHVDGFGSGADVELDLRKPLPFYDAIADGIFSEHTLEHLTYADGARLLAECRRVLRPGGRVRIVVPDLSILMRAYVEGSDAIRRYGELVMAPHKHALRTPMMAVAFMAQEFGHVSAWDEATLRTFLTDVGFVDVTVQKYRESADPKLAVDDPDPGRTDFSLYMDALRP